MSFQTLPNAPTQTPLFRALNVKDLLRGSGSLFGFLLGDVWSKWFNLLSTKLQPLLIVATLDFPLTAAFTSSEATVTVPGAQTDHYAEVAPPVGSVPANSLYYAWVSADSTVTIRFCNFSAAAINPAVGDFTIVVRQ